MIHAWAIILKPCAYIMSCLYYIIIFTYVCTCAHVLHVLCFIVKTNQITIYAYMHTGSISIFCCVSSTNYYFLFSCVNIMTVYSQFELTCAHIKYDCSWINN